MLPDYRADNPYQELLSQALATAGCQVTFPPGYRRGLPLWRTARTQPQAKILHLHWTSPYIRHAGPVRGWIYSLKLLADIGLLKLSRRQLVWTMHNLISHDYRYARRERWLHRMLCRLASKVIVHSEDGRQQAIAAFGCPADRVVAIPHGHYRSIYGKPLPKQEARQQLQLPASPRLLMLFGLLRPYKGIERLLRAWQSLSKSPAAASATLLLVGEFLDPAYQQQIERMVSETSRVRLIAGRVPNDQVATWFSAADVAVLPFERIQTSGSVLLAMSFGLPVIAPQLGDVPETLAGADDLMFDASDGKALARQIEAALNLSEPHLADLRQRTELACNRFEWSSIGARTAALYESVSKSEAG